MNYLILNILTIGLLFASTPGFAQEHHHGHNGSDKATQPIIEIMRGMNTNLNKLTDAVILEDFSLIASSAHDIANHPGIDQEDLNQLFERLGNRKQAFISCDSAVHNLAADISKAAEAQNMDLVLEKYAAMLAKTVECHQKYRLK